MPFSHVILTNSALTSSLKVVARARTLASTSSYIIVDNTARPHTTGRIQPGRRLSFRSSSNKNAILQRFYSFDYRTSGGWLAQTDPIHDQDDTEATANMPIMHIVLFEFKPTLHHTQIEDVCTRLYFSLTSTSAIDWQTLPATMIAYCTDVLLSDLQAYARTFNRLRTPNDTKAVRDRLRWRSRHKSGRSSGSQPLSFLPVHALRPVMPFLAQPATDCVQSDPSAPLQGGFSHGFISEFQNEADRKYYLEEDPAHLEFVKSLDGIVENVRVVDFENGKF